MILKNAILQQNNQDKIVDIRIENDIIVEIGNDLKRETHQIDASGLYVLPGIVDLNISLKDDTLNRKNIIDITTKAKNSGVTTMLLRSSYDDGDIDETFVEILAKSIDSQEDIDIHIAAKALNMDEKLANITILQKNGVKAFFIDADAPTNALRRVMQYAHLLSIPIFIKPIDKSLEDKGVMHEGEYSYSLGLPGIPSIAEVMQTAKIKELAQHFEATVIMAQVSVAEACKLVEESNNCYTQVSLHNLILDDSACEGFNTYAKLYPPLRDTNTKDNLIEVLKAGRINVLTSAHSAKSEVLKDRPFEDAAYGIDTLKIYLSLAYTHLVKSGHITLEQLSKLISKNPATILGLTNIGEIKVGNIADVILFNPKVKQMYNNTHSPYHNSEIYGKIIHTIIKGKLVPHTA